jgi:hypothetical protein
MAIELNDNGDEQWAFVRTTYVFGVRDDEAERILWFHFRNKFNQHPLGTTLQAPLIGQE